MTDEIPEFTFPRDHWAQILVKMTRNTASPVSLERAYEMWDEARAARDAGPMPEAP